MEWTTPETLEAGAMSGAVLETHVFGELLKGWWHRGLEPLVYYYRDKDGREIDFIFVQDRVLYPIEVKKTASPTIDDLYVPATLRAGDTELGPGAVVCLCRELLPLSKSVHAVPIGLL